RQKNVRLDVSIMLVNMIQSLGFYINYYHSQKTQIVVFNNFTLFLIINYC
ncbi:uncharacterized protein METZ01_LOCUS461221, partial [marine metagenome]